MVRKKKRRKQRSHQTGAPPHKPSKALAVDKGPRFIKIRNHLDIIAAGFTSLLFTIHLLIDDSYFLGSGTDIVSMQHPLHVFATNWLSQGILPLWNPFVWGGIPFQSGVHGYLYPLSWTGIYLPAGLDIKLGIVLHLIIASTGAVWFVRSRVKAPLPAFMAGIVYAHSAFFMSHLYAGHRILVATAAYLPWIAGAILRCDTDKRYRIIGVMLSGLMMLAAHYQVIFIGFGGVLLWRLFERLFEIKWRSFTPMQLKPLGSSALCWLIIFIGGALIAAVQLIPMFALVPLSQRAGGDASFAASYSSAPLNLATLIWPNLFGNRVEVPFVGEWSYWEALPYIGLPAICLVIIASALLPWRKVVPAYLVIVLSLLLSMGDYTPIFEVYLALVPGADLFRSPGRFCLLSTLLAVFLIAAVLDTWISGSLSRTRQTVGLLLAWCCAIALAIIPWVLFSFDMSSFESWMRYLSETEALKKLSDTQWSDLKDVVYQDMIAASVIMPLTALALTLGALFPSRLKLITCIIIGITMFELYGFGQRFLTTSDAKRFHLPQKIVETLLDDAPPGTRIIPPAVQRWYNFPAMYNVGNPGGYDIFLDRRFARYINRSQANPLDLHLALSRLRRGSPLIRHLGPKYVLTTYPLKKGRNVFVSGYNWVEPYKQIEHIYVYKNKNEPFRAALVHQVEIVPDEKDAYRKMEDPNFDIRKTVLVEAPLPKGFPSPQPVSSNISESATIKNIQPNRVDLEVIAQGNAVLVMSDTLQPGWTAEVDGKEVPMVHANRVMRALPVPKGKHTVIMRYRPASFFWGLAVTLASIVGLVSILVMRRQKRK